MNMDCEWQEDLKLGRARRVPKDCMILGALYADRMSEGRHTECYNNGVMGGKALVCSPSMEGTTTEFAGEDERLVPNLVGQPGG